MTIITTMIRQIMKTLTGLIVTFTMILVTNR